MNQIKSNIKIRNIGIEEIHLLVEYRLFYLKELQGEDNNVNETQLKADLEDYFKRTFLENRLIAFLGEMDEKVVSLGAIVKKEIPGDFNKATYLEGDILNMYTVPEARQKGISSLILEKLIEAAKRHGISKLALHSTKDGENIYRRFGFSEPEYPYLEKVINTKIFTH